MQFILDFLQGFQVVALASKNQTNVKDILRPFGQHEDLIQFDSFSWITAKNL